MKNKLGKVIGAAYGLVGSVAGGLNLAKHVDFFADKSPGSMSQVAQRLDTPSDQLINILTLPAQVPSRMYEYLSGNNILLNAPAEAGFGVAAATVLGYFAGNFMQDATRKIRKYSPLE